MAHGEVNVRFGPTLETTLAVTADMTTEAAGRWLDDQFVALGAEPLRASGKVLLLDKILAVAIAAGASRFTDDAGWAGRFASAVHALVGRDAVRVEVDTMTVGY